MKIKSKPLIWIVLALGAGAVFLLYRQNAAAAALRVAPDPASVQVVPSGDAGGGASYGGSSQGVANLDPTQSLIATYMSDPVAYPGGGSGGAPPSSGPFGPPPGGLVAYPGGGSGGAPPHLPGPVGAPAR